MHLLLATSSQLKPKSGQVSRGGGYHFYGGRSISFVPCSNTQCAAICYSVTMIFFLPTLLAIARVVMEICAFNVQFPSGRVFIF
ncbi:uncharacterized protein EI97DRAFT_283857 [Westerdykella ornata]|uniref:Uncharacterized protein n=1 Tax=Westerdykella ornata TaxID=318751 RepID=A0A6A6J5D6_WESOR|nr:uncharacterized protein EI97DRAFT_283857 [Westerdykella ornata]KAF2271407.1 hypothetical protein EI97DRAFT_283857 [Westerdykella ornata]